MTEYPKVVLLVTGGRDYADVNTLRGHLDRFLNHFKNVELVQGGARGADRLAKEWAEERGVVQREHKADWDTHGVAAGPIRNSEMLEKEKPDYVMVFHGGNGTADMKRKSLAASFVKKVYIVDVDGRIWCHAP